MGKPERPIGESVLFRLGTTKRIRWHLSFTGLSPLADWLHSVAQILFSKDIVKSFVQCFATLVRPLGRQSFPLVFQVACNVSVQQLPRTCFFGERTYFNRQVTCRNTSSACCHIRKTRRCSARM